MDQTPSLDVGLLSGKVGEGRAGHDNEPLGFQPFTSPAILQKVDARLGSSIDYARSEHLVPVGDQSASEHTEQTDQCNDNFDPI